MKEAEKIRKLKADMQLVTGLKSNDLIPRHASLEEMRLWIREKIHCEMPTVWSTSLTPDTFSRNIENYVGTAQIPIGIAGPILINGDHASGLHYVPFATTEGVLVDSYHRGMLAISKSGGASVQVLQDQIDISPLFTLDDKNSFNKFRDWLEKNFSILQTIVGEKTKHGRLIRYELSPLSFGRVITTFYFFTQDAMGLNMINIATNEICQYVKSKFPIRGFYLRSNYSSDKKVSYHNLIEGYGKTVLATAVLYEPIIVQYLRTSLEKFYDFWFSTVFASIQAGMIGLNAQFANALAAIYIATGQDVAQIVNASCGVSMVEKEGDCLKISVKVPNLVCGTVGGGTHLPTQRECLRLMNCEGEGTATKLAEIVAATILAGEISIGAALSGGYFSQAHEMKKNLVSHKSKNKRGIRFLQF